MSDFTPFGEDVTVQFNKLQTEYNRLYVVDVSKTEIWDAYLAAFPEGTNPMFRERTEHDCNTCKAFIRNLGHVVALDDKQNYVTVWDNHAAYAEPYKTVAREMARLINGRAIRSIFAPGENAYGSPETLKLREDGTVETYAHFHGSVRRKFQHSLPAMARGAADTNFATLKRAVTEITPDAITTVLELIDANHLYRGEQYRALVAELQTTQNQFRLRSAERRDNYIWANHHKSVAHVRNSAIGTLLVDLSEGVELEEAVKKYEAVTAPANYKRPTALITQAMIDKALSQLRELDLELAVERRFARLSDVSVNDVLWASAPAQSVMRDGLKDLLMAAPQVKRKAVDVNNAKEIGADEFLKTVVPGAKQMSVYLAHETRGNLVSLSAPVHMGVTRLFQWDNNFAWAYKGGVTDAIKERVKRAGGKVDGVLRVSLAWDSPDDLDLHCMPPHGGEIYYGNKQEILDVDANGGCVTNATDPVENMNFQRLTDGTYKFHVHQYSRRGADSEGFTLEVAYGGETHQFFYAGSVAHDRRVGQLVITATGGKVVDVKLLDKTMTSARQGVDVWGVKTETFVPVTALMYSPNYWGDNSVGHRHWIFALEGCVNDEPIRGIYNEFLRSELTPHRKVFEVLGSRTACLVTPDQISGVGFSGANNNTAVVDVDGALYKVVF